MAAAARLKEEKARFAAEVSSPDLSRLSDEDDDDFWDDAGAAERLGAAAERMLAAETSGRGGVTPAAMKRAPERAPDGKGSTTDKLESVSAAVAPNTPNRGALSSSAINEALMRAMRKIIEDCDTLYKQTALAGECFGQRLRPFCQVPCVLLYNPSSVPPGSACCSNEVLSRVMHDPTQVESRTPSQSLRWRLSCATRSELRS